MDSTFQVPQVLTLTTELLGTSALYGKLLYSILPIASQQQWVFDDESEAQILSQWQ